MMQATERYWARSRWSENQKQKKRIRDLNLGGQRNFDLRGIVLWLMISFGLHFIAVVLDQQPLIFGERSIHRNARNKLLTSAGKFMHLV